MDCQLQEERSDKVDRGVSFVDLCLVLVFTCMCVCAVDVCSKDVAHLEQEVVIGFVQSDALLKVKLIKGMNTIYPDVRSLKLERNNIIKQESIGCKKNIEVQSKKTRTNQQQQQHNLHD